MLCGGQGVIPNIIGSELIIRKLTGPVIAENECDVHL
jgi:hypothetical protein